jgi:hypothetical protein
MNIDVLVPGTVVLYTDATQPCSDRTLCIVDRGEVIRRHLDQTTYSWDSGQVH